MGNGRSFLLFSLLLLSNRLRADIVINEIMYNSAGPTETNREYVELHNTGATSVDLGSWVFKESDSVGGYNSYTISAGQQISAGGYLILTNADSVSGFQGDYPSTPGDVPVLLFEMRLINSPNGTTTEELILIDNSSSPTKTVDQLIYDNANPWPNVADGYSIELTSPTADNSQGANWRQSLVSGGTPGQVNSVTPEPSSLTMLLTGLLPCLLFPRKRSFRPRSRDGTSGSQS